MPNKIKLDITWTSLFRIAAFISIILLAIQLKAIIITLLIAVIIMSAMIPAVEYFTTRFKFPYTPAIITVFLSTLTVIGILLFLVFPPFIDQLFHFFERFPLYVSSLTSAFTFLTPDQASSLSTSLTDLFSSQISGVFGNLVKITLGVFSGLLTFITIAVFTFYLLLERPKIKSHLHLFIPTISKKIIDRLSDEVEFRLGAWVRGQLSLSLIIGVATLVGLNLLTLIFYLVTGKYPEGFVSMTVPLAIIAGILEIVPIIGPIISAVPAFIVAYSHDPSLGISVIALYILIQQLEAHMIVPLVMNRAVGLNPLLVLIALLIGGSLLGVIGTLIAVPVAAIIQIVYSEYSQYQDKN